MYIQNNHNKNTELYLKKKNRILLLRICIKINWILIKKVFKLRIWLILCDNGAFRVYIYIYNMFVGMDKDLLLLII